jgi:hypothetical protein
MPRGGGSDGCGAWVQPPPVSTRLPAFTQPRMPSGITNSLEYPSFAASRAASWLAVQLGLAQ